VEIDGIGAPARNFVPVAIGDQVATQNGAAVVQFRDGSSVSLQPNSKLRIEGETSRPEVRILRGVATYKLVPSSHLRVVDSKGDVIGGILDRAIPGAATFDPASNPAAAAAVYRGGAAPSAAIIAPRAVITVGSFTTGSFSAGTSTSGPQIVAPNGLKINLIAITDPTTGATTGYKITSITQTVINTTTGQSVEVTASTGSLIGATINTVSGSTSTGTSVTLQFTTSTGAVLTPEQSATAVQATVNTAVQDAVQAGTLPAGTTAPQPAPVTTGQFSANGT
jgi:hypothetical protein